MKNLVKTQTNCILQKSKKMEMIQYITNSEYESDEKEENERKEKQKQRQNCKELNASPVIIQLTKHV